MKENFYESIDRLDTFGYCFQIYTKKKREREIITHEEYSKQAKSLLVHLTNDSVKNTTEFVQLACRVNKRRKSLQRKLVELHLPVDWVWKKK